MVNVATGLLGAGDG